MMNAILDRSCLKEKIKGYFSLDLLGFEELVGLLFVSKKRTNFSSILMDYFDSGLSINDYIAVREYDVPMLPFLISEKRKKYFEEAILSISNDNMEVN